MAKSRFNYITPEELATYIHTMSGVTDAALAAKFITDAEALIDAYVGPNRKFYTDLTGELSQEVSTGFGWPSTIFGSRRPNYWAKGGVYVEILEVPGNPTSSLLGLKRLIVESQDNQATLVDGFPVTVPSGTVFLIHQESRFPRWVDTDPFGTPRMPDELKQAVAWQVEYGIHFGSEEFGLGDSNVSTDEAGAVQSRTYGSGYSETRLPGQDRGMARFIAPKSRLVLRELLNATGHLL